MNKEYNQPQAKYHPIKNKPILSGSVSVGSGRTLEQNAKKVQYDFYDYEEDDDE